MVDPREWLRIRHPGPDLQGPFELAVRLGGANDHRAGGPRSTRAAPVAGPARRTSGGPGPPAPRSVAGEFGMGVEGLAVRRVEPAALARQHFVVDRVPSKRVAERVPASGLIDDEEMLSTASRRPAKAVSSTPETVRAIARGPTAHRRRRSSGCVSGPTASSRGAARRAATGGGRWVPAGQHHTEQLLDEEGVALGPLEDAVDQIGLGGVAEDCGQLIGHLEPVEAGQLVDLDGRARSQASRSERSGWRRLARRSGRCRRRGPVRRVARGPGRRAGPGSTGRPSAGPRSRSAPDPSARVARSSRGPAPQLGPCRSARPARRRPADRGWAAPQQGPRAGPRARSNSSRGIVRASTRRASTSGAKGKPSVPSCMH